MLLSFGLLTEETRKGRGHRGCGPCLFGKKHEAQGAPPLSLAVG